MARVEQQPFDIPFVSGVSEDVPEKLLPPERLLLVENADINKRGVIRKKRSFVDAPMTDTAASTIGPGIRKLARFRDQLLAFDQSNRLAYSLLPTREQWSPVGDYTPCLISDEEIDGTSVDNFIGTSPAFTEGIDFHTSLVEKYGYYVVTHGQNYFVIDKSNLAIVSSGQLSGVTNQSMQFVRSVDIPASDRIVVITAGPAITAHFVDLNQPENGVISSIVLANDGPVGNTRSIDAAPVYNGNAEFMVAWKNVSIGAFGIAARVFNDAGAPVSNIVGSTFSFVSEDRNFVVLGAPRQGVGGNTYWLFWADKTNGDWYRIVFTYTGAVLTVVQTEIPLGLTTISGKTVFSEGGGACAHVFDATTCWFFAGEGDGSDFPLQPGGHIVMAIVNNGSGALLPSEFQNRGLDIMSQPFLYDGELYFIGNIGTEQRLQNTYFLMRFNSISERATVVGRFLVGRARENHGGSPLGGAVNPFGWQVTEVVEDQSAPGRFHCVLPKSGSDFVTGGVDNAIYGSTLVTIDFNETGNTAVIGDTLYSLDGTLWAYDGQDLVESGFHVFPEKLESVGVAGTGLLTAGQYQAVAVYAWYDSYGRVYRSAPTPLPAEVTSAGGDYWDIKIPTLQLTSKDDVKIEVYRSTSNNTTPGFFLEKVFDNDPTYAFVSEQLIPPLFTYLGDTGGIAGSPQDGLNDTDLVNQPQLYTDSGELDHIAPPQASYIAVHGNRLWVVSGDNLFYSKTWREGFGIQFNDAQRVIVDPKGGDIVGVASLGEQLLIGKEERLLRLYGAGPNDLGVGAFSEPLELTSDVGVTPGTPMLEWQHGVTFRSPKGIWNVNKDFSMNDIGRSIDDLNKLPVLNALTSTDKEEFWYLVQDASASLLLAFDWHAEQWISRRLTFQSQPTGPMALWRNDLYLADDSGTILVESDSVHDTTRIKTGVFRPGGITGFHRMWWIYLHMVWKAAHTINVRLWYEDGTYEDFSKEFLSAQEPQILRIKPKRQKETGYQIEIWDSDFSLADCCEWYGLTLVAGVKPQRLPVQRSKNVRSE